MLRESLPDDLPVVFISAVTGLGIQQLKDVLWSELNNESNKLQDIVSEEKIVHRDKDMTRFSSEMAAEGEDIIVAEADDEESGSDDIGDFDDEEEYI